MKKLTKADNTIILTIIVILFINMIIGYLHIKEKRTSFYNDLLFEVKETAALSYKKGYTDAVARFLKSGIITKDDFKKDSLEHIKIYQNF